jgi:hypothetical protein
MLGVIRTPSLLTGRVKSGFCEPKIEITGIPTYAARCPAMESGAIRHF